QYFADHDLRDLISKDVGRTFPELEFFQQEHIRRMMCDILLIYAKENSYVSYKQCVFFHMNSLNMCFFEHHLVNFSGMFCEVMLEVAKWYEDNSSSPKPSVNESGPFMRVQDATPTSHIMRELVVIGERLHSVDPILADHLSHLDIPPQLYGIRWLRLLFGREFSIHDLLYVWDVLLCDRPMERMVECIFIAMLIQIRHLLLQSDYGGCLQYLMRYPPVVDVTTFIQQALHFRNPKKYARPTSLGALNNFSHMTVTGADHPNRGRQGPPTTNNLESPLEETATGLRNLTSSMLSKVKNTVLEKPREYEPF
ncbi:unnamed protein product, partial [Strongylus vulgaris]